MLKVRKVLTDDRDIILEWRNDPRVYKYALSPVSVLKEDHIQWFEKVLISPVVIFYMGTWDGVRCGTVRYNLTNNGTEAEVSISISPDFWGKGIASQLMKLSEEKLKEDTNVKLIHATVLNENLASMALFKKSAFSEHITQFKKEI
jgi:RimJ/RimL family protein N-acetyltransferase